MTEHAEMEQFIKENFPFESDFQWQGREALVNLDKDRIATVKLSDFETHDDYNGFLVQIISKHSGFIDERSFYFTEIMGYPPKDQRPFPIPYKVVRSCGWKWYCATNPSKKQRELVVQYIAEYLSSWI